MEWREEELEGKLVGQVARRSRLSRIRAPGGKFVDARGVGVAEGDSPLHKMPIVVDLSQEFGTAITPLMEPPLPLSTGEDRGSVGSSTLGQRGRPLSNFGVSFPRASSPLIRESTRFTYRVAQIYDLLRNNGDPCLKEERANGEFSNFEENTFDHFSSSGDRNVAKFKMRLYFLNQFQYNWIIFPLLDCLNDLE